MDTFLCGAVLRGRKQHEAWKNAGGKERQNPDHDSKS
jgi:hypothetical protein